ncbi:MAG: phosphotransferase [Clostridium sp.]|nr:phosphotransferase [Clostridium sp.]
MNDKAVSLLEQYDIEVQRTRKGRGAILCDTTRGCLIFKEYIGNTDKVAVQDKLLKQISRMGKVSVEAIFPAKDGSLLVKDHDNVSYILKTYFEGRECNIYDKGECVEAVRTLALLHSCMEVPEEDCPGLLDYLPGREYEKHNRELRRVKRYLQKKGQKTWFEIALQDSIGYFLEQAEEITGEWQSYADAGTGSEKSCPKVFCHGDYQYHNILRTERGWGIINFEKCLLDNPIRDLYLLVRKLLEKSSWSIPLGKELLKAYDSILPISLYSRIDLYYRLAYPEKFWKIVNFYYNSGKAWIPEKNQEKLEKLLSQEKEKQHFLDVVFREIAKPFL